MRQSEQRFRHESLQDATSIRDILKAITDGIANGKLVFSDEDGEIVMQPEGLLRLKLSASQTKCQHRISLRIVWQLQDAAPSKGNSLAVCAEPDAYE